MDVGLIIAFELEQSSVSGMAIAALTGALEAARPATVANNINGMLSGAA